MTRIKSNDIFNEALLNVSLPDDNAIPSEKNLKIQLSLRIMNRFPIYDDNDVKTNEVDAISPLKINICKLSFYIDGIQRTSIDLSNDQPSWTKGYNIIFLKGISKQDIEYLSKWKSNRSLFIGFKTRGFAKVNGYIHEFDLELPINQFKLGIDDFESTFLKNTDLQFTYSREFGLSSPLIKNLASKQALNELYDHICNLHNNLEQALRALRLSGDPLEALILIRQPLDVIKELKNNSNLISDIAKQLYVDTNILVDLNPSSNPANIGGGQTAATEIIQKLVIIFDILFEFSSKAFHTKTRYPKGLQPVTFKMSPEYHDAEFSLTLALTTTNYLIERIKRSCE